jgi:hypothetical protein
VCPETVSQQLTVASTIPTRAEAWEGKVFFLGKIAENSGIPLLPGTKKGRPEASLFPEYNHDSGTHFQKLRQPEH